MIEIECPLYKDIKVRVTGTLYHVVSDARILADIQTFKCASRRGKCNLPCVEGCTLGPFANATTEKAQEAIRQAMERQKASLHQNQ